MALSFVSYNGDGGTRNFAVPFTYIAKTDVTVLVNGSPVSFIWLNSSLVQTAVAPAVGTTVQVRRFTQRGSKLVDFQDSSTLTESDLDLASTQSLYLAQENGDKAGEALLVNAAASFQFDALSKRIINVANPTSPQDAATKSWTETTFSLYLSASVAAMNAAQGFANDSSASATSSSGFAAAASGSAAAAATSSSQAAARAADALASQIAAAASAATVSSYVNFTQQGTGATPITIPSMFYGRVFTPEQFNPNPSDMGPAINRAITAASAVKGTVELVGVYTVVTPIVDSTGVDVIGKGFFGAMIVFAPISNNLICYRVRNAGAIVTGGSLRNVQFYSNDGTFTKTAIELEDFSQYDIANVYVKGAIAVPGVANFWSGGTGSCGLRTKGREFLRVRGFVAFADRPIVIAKNPNHPIDIDVSEFSGIGLVANGYPCIQIDDGVAYTRLSFSNVHCARGTYGIYNNDTTSTLPSIGLNIHNFGYEQCTNSAGYNILINRSGVYLVHNLAITGYSAWDPTCNGISLKNCFNPRLDGVFYQGSGYALTTTSTVYGLSWFNCNFQVGSMTTFAGQRLVWSDDLAAGYPIPRSAVWSSTADSGAFVVGTSLVMPGSTSGRTTVIAKPVAGSPVIEWPTTSGTVALTDAAGWTAFTANLSAISGGALGTGNTVVARYKMVTAKTCLVHYKITMGASGLGAASHIGVDLPFAAFSDGVLLLRNRTTAMSGTGDIGLSSTSVAVLMRYDGNFIAANSQVIVVQGQYEIA